MLPYIELHAENLILLLGYGLLGFLGLALAKLSSELGVGKARDGAEPAARFRDGLAEGRGRVPLFLVVLFVLLGVWAVFYVLAHVVWGLDFGG